MFIGGQTLYFIALLDMLEFMGTDYPLRRSHMDTCCGKSRDTIKEDNKRKVTSYKDYGF